MLLFGPVMDNDQYSMVLYNPVKTSTAVDMLTIPSAYGLHAFTRSVESVNSVLFKKRNEGISAEM